MFRIHKQIAARDFSQSGTRLESGQEWGSGKRRIKEEKAGKQLQQHQQSLQSVKLEREETFNPGRYVAVNDNH
jgi:hypothetical protein